MHPAFFVLHSDLPRQGPGSRESLDWALDRAGVPASGSILDAACGPGADIAGLLAHVPDGHVTAIDAHAPFVEEARANWGNDPRVTLVTGRMETPPGGPFDLIWCAGALYFLGVEAGLSGWRDHLKPGGVVAFSEPVFKIDSPSARAAGFWGGTTVGRPGDIAAAVDRAGFDALSWTYLDDAAWEAYYTPMEARIAKLRPDADASLTEMLDAGAEEAATWRACKDETGYALFVVRKR